MDVFETHKKQRSPVQKFSRLFACLAGRITAGRFERAVLRGSVPDQRSEFHLAGDRIWRFEFSLEHQRSRIAANVADRKFRRARKRYRVLVSWRPLRFRGFCGPPTAQRWVHQQESALTVVLSVEAQRALVPVSEIDLHIPSTDHVWRLGLSRRSAKHLDH